MRLQHGRAQGWEIPAVEVGAGATRAPLPSPSLAAPGLARPGGWRARCAGGGGVGWASAMGGREQRRMGAWQQRSRVGTRCPDGKAATGEGHHVGKGQWQADGAVDAPVAVICVRQ
jgi:hypothetical protein